MRLLHTTRIEVVEFAGRYPPYAILSHRWEEEEVTLSDLQPNGRAKQMKGYAKIQNSCRLAARKGFQYIWIDTCCIDKTSSAELSEAINSMFRWYQEAKICYAFLSDVPADTPTDPSTITITMREAAMREMTASQWFTRGWTLQELVAPRALDFYSQEWIYLGSRDAAAKTLELATGIPARVLFGQGLSGISVHHRMQWVATRSTTRPEDIAYCLLGIFDVNMPLLYGEGKKKAFQRLQEEIVKTSTDLSIFLWTVPRNEQDGPDLEFRGPLAEDPSWFTASGFQPKNDSRIVPLQDTAMSITNKGISVQWIILSVRGDTAKTLYVAMLAGAGEIKGGIVIQQLDDEATQFCRVFSDKVIWLDRQGVMTEVLNHDLLGHPKDLLVATSPAKAMSFHMHRNFDLSNIPSLPGVGFSFTQRIICYNRYNSTRPWLCAPICASVKAASPEFYLDSDFPAETWCARFRLEQNSKPIAISHAQHDKQEVLGALAISISGSDKSDTRWHCVVVGVDKLPKTILGTTNTFLRPWFCCVDMKDPRKAIKHVESFLPSPLRYSDSGQKGVGAYEYELKKVSRASGIWYDISVKKGPF